MKENNMVSQKVFVREPVVQDWLRYEFIEEDFLLGKTSEFSSDIWEDEE